MAKTTLYKIHRFEEWMGQILVASKYKHSTMSVKDIFRHDYVVKRLDPIMAVINRPITMEDFGMPVERTLPQTF